MRNVILICLDSVRKDMYEGEMTQVKELVDVSLHGCRSASSWSVPSHGSFLSGKLPHEHGVHTHNIDFSQLNRSTVLTTDSLFENRFSVSANQFTSSEFGFDKWFDECHTVGSTVYHPQGLDVRQTSGGINHFLESITHEYPIKSIKNGIISACIRASDSLPVRSPFDDGAKSINKLSKDVIDSADEPFLLFTNFMEAHHPLRLISGYRNKDNVSNWWSSNDIDLMAFNNGTESIKDNQKYVENFRSLYRAAIDYLDRRVANFVLDIKERTDGEVTFIVTADHGENLGYESDNFLFEHTGSLSEGLLHVPFDIINPPTTVDIGEACIFSQKSLGDIVAKIVREEPITIQNQKYVSAELVGGGPIENPEDYWDRMIRCVYDTEAQTKITWDTAGDVFETDLAGSEDSEYHSQSTIDKTPSWATKQFSMGISEYKERAKSDESHISENIDTGTKERLEELGYL